MSKDHSPAFIFQTHAQADEAIRKVANSGFDMSKLSIIGKGYHSEEHPIGFYTHGDKIKAWGKSGAFWGGIWGLLLAPAVFLVPGLGLLAMAGPIVPTLVGCLEGAALIGGVSALGAALTQFGMSKEQLIKYESAVKVDHYVVLVHGNADDIAKVSALLKAGDTPAAV